MAGPHRELLGPGGPVLGIQGRPDPPPLRQGERVLLHVREDTLAPVLLWWVAALGGWVITDGHDRAVAALAEGRTPPRAVLRRCPTTRRRRRVADEVSAGHEQRLERLSGGPGAERQGETLVRSYGDVLSGLPYETARTRSWPLPGGAPAWDALAAAAMFECPRD